jgi:vacuolar-type H+-ATPase subunit E/Vma4
VVLTHDVTLAPLRDALLAAARGRAAGVQAEAAAQVESQLAAAREEADAHVVRARAEAQRQAELETQRRLSSGRRDAQGRVLRAREAAYESLRKEAIGAALGLRAEPGYEALLDRLEADARGRLGPGATIQRDPADAGGVIARDGQRRIDATLPALVERALDELGPEVETLWA